MTEKKDKTIWVRITPELYAKLKKYSKDHGDSVSTSIRNILRDYLK